MHRRVALGLSILVVYLESVGGIRVVSARKATSHERRRVKNPDEPTAESLAEVPEVADWSSARKNPYAARLGIRKLAPDLARAFPDDSSVEAALRELLASNKSA